MKSRSFYVSVFFALALLSVSCGNNAKQESDTHTVDINDVINDSSEAGSGSDEISELISNQDKESSDLVSKQVILNGKPTIIDFNASWCAPCKHMEPIFRKLANEYGDKYNFVSIDIDENKELADKYNIQSIPAFIFLDESGKEGNRIIGRIAETELREELDHPIWF